MVFYVSLFLASLIVGGLVVWFYRFVVQTSRSTYRSILPSANENLREAAVNGVALSRQQVRGQAAPWGWKKRGDDTKRTSVAVPAYTRSKRSQVGWPYRDEPFGDTLGTVKPGSKVVKARKVGKGGIDKPWGW